MFLTPTPDSTVTVTRTEDQDGTHLECSVCHDERIDYDDERIDHHFFDQHRGGHCCECNGEGRIYDDENRRSWVCGCPAGDDLR